MKIPDVISLCALLRNIGANVSVFVEKITLNKVNSK